MSIANYGDLKASVAAWLNRTDLTAVIPDFITLAEAHLSRELKTRDQVSTATLSTSAGDADVALPEDFGAAKVFTLQSDPKAVLTPCSVLELETKYAPSAAGAPRSFSIAGANARLGPVPDGVYGVEAVYYARLPALSDEDDTNWLLTDHPDAYLYATLVQSAPYLGDDTRVGVWSTLLQAVLESINTENVLSEWTAGSASKPDLYAAP